MKVLHIIDSLGLGGAQTILRGVFEAQKDNPNIFLFALREREQCIKIDHKNIFINQSKRKYSLQPLKPLRDLIRKEKIDVLHCHLFRSQIFGFLLKKIWFKNIKLVMHEHSGIIEDGILYKILMNKSQDEVDRIIASSQALKKKLLTAHIRESKINVLYNFVNLKKFSKKEVTWDLLVERSKLGISPTEFVIGFSGRLVERKGWKEFIYAANEIALQENNVKFLIAGTGSQKEKMLLLMKELGLEERIVYLGYVDNMPWFYSLLDCFVLASYWEGLSMVQLEVLGMGLPLVTSNGPGMNEVAEENSSCLYVDVKNSKQITDRVLKIKRDPELRERLSQNAVKAAAGFSLERFLNELEEIYASL